MCEFDLIVDGKTVLRDVIYARMEGNKVIVRDILGSIREYPNHRIEEVDVNSTRLVLSTAQK
ncbi:MAG: CooT family nickel-binding protein [Nitrososphaerota archaeon]